MKKWLMISGIAFVVVLGVALITGAFLAGTAIVKAQAPTPPQDGVGPRGGWRMGGEMPMREYMHTALAEKLGITEEELEAQIADGKAIYQIAEEKGLTADEITTLMNDAHKAALEKMVAEGVITQEQADLMSQHSAGMMGGRGGNGECPMFDGDDSDGSTGKWGGFGGMMRGNGRHNPGMMGGNR